MKEKRMGQRETLWKISMLTALVCGLGVSALPNITHAQGTILEEEPAATERAQEAERAREREAARERAAERERDIERAKTADYPQDRRQYERPGELYVAGFGGYTFGHGITNPEGTGTLTGADFANAGIGLNDSVVYGLKIGYFMPNRLNWLGVEVEGFNTNPDIKPHREGQGEPNSEGSRLRVTTLAFNLIARGKLACRSRQERDSRNPATGEYRNGEFCPLQPYIGVGLGVFFATAKDEDGQSSDNAVPGLNALAGVRYFFTERIALFAEYKYNRASFNFDTIDNGPGGQGGVKGDYSVSHVVGGLSLHF